MTPDRLLIDTDVLVDYLQGEPQASQFLENTLICSDCFVSSITIAELYVGVREGKERKVLDLFVQEFEISAVDQQIAQRGGLFRRDYGKSHGVGLADAIIAATAIELNLKLITLNKKHYPMVQNAYIPYFKEHMIIK